MKPRPTSDADTAAPVVRVVIVTLDSHLASATERAQHLLLRETVHHMRLGKACGLGHSCQIRQRLGEIKGRHMRTCLLEFIRWHRRPARTHVAEVTIQVVLPRLALLAHDIDHDQHSAGGKPTRSGMEKLLLIFSAQMMNGET